METFRTDRPPCGIKRFPLGKIVGAITLAVTFFLVLSGSRADLVFMKDGFVLQGKVRRDHQIELDPSTKEAIAYPKGFFQVDDGTRRQYFLPSQARIAEKDLPETEEKISFPKVQFIPHGRPMPSIWEIVQVDEWDDKWDRSFIFKGPNGLVGMRQHLGTVTPTWARVDALNRHRWGCMYLTEEFSSQTLRKLLDSNPDTMDKPDASTKERLAKANKRLSFFVQAGRSKEAEEEVLRMGRFGADAVDLVEKGKSAVAILKASEQIAKAKRLSNSKQFKESREALESFAMETPSERLVDEAKGILAESEATAERDVRVRKLISKLATVLPKDDPMVKPLEGVLAEFHPDGLERLESFIGQGEAWEKSSDTGDGSKAAKLAALAVSGWVLGKASAEDNAQKAARIWDLRAGILRILKMETREARAKAITENYKSMGSESVEEIALMIPFLPPFRQEKDPGKGIREISPEADKPFKPRFHVQLPPGYHPGKKWPLLVVLHGTGEKPAEHLARWGQRAGEEGYVVIAPHWEIGGPKSGYAYSPKEHDVVLDSIREAKNRWRVDDDRVFLFGLDAGGNAAFDIGLSHPDWFAGVLPMSGGAFYFAAAYWRNAQQLPFYVCNGDYAGDLNLKNREIFSNWASRSFPMIWSQYKGRGIEWFGGELPQMMDWMRPKKRQYSLSGLGNGGGLGVLGNDYRTLRPTDDQFYWIRFGEISKGSQMTGDRWQASTAPATLAAWVDKAANKINVRSSNCLEIVVQIVRNSNGEGNVRLDKPVSIVHKISTVWNQRKIDPDLTTLLETVASRGEREILVMKEIRFKP